MSPIQKRVATVLASLGGAVLALLAMAPLVIRNMSPVTAGMIEGVAGCVCLLGVGLGIWNVRRGEARRKAKEQIWLKH